MARFNLHSVLFIFILSCYIFRGILLSDGLRYNHKLIVAMTVKTNHKIQSLTTETPDYPKSLVTITTTINIREYTQSAQADLFLEFKGK